MYWNHTTNYTSFQQNLKGSTKTIPLSKTSKCICGLAQHLVQRIVPVLALSFVKSKTAVPVVSLPVPAVVVTVTMATLYWLKMQNKATKKADREDIRSMNNNSTKNRKNKQANKQSETNKKNLKVKTWTVTLKITHCLFLLQFALACKDLHHVQRICFEIMKDKWKKSFDHSIGLYQLKQIRVKQTMDYSEICWFCFKPLMQQRKQTQELRTWTKLWFNICFDSHTNTNKKCWTCI